MEIRFTKKQKMFAVFMAVVGVVMFSAKAIMVKMAYVYDVEAVPLLLIRMGIALPFYAGVSVFISIKKKGKRTQGLNAKDILALVLLGFLGYYLASFLDFEGLNYVSASLERLILFVYPTLVLLLSFIVLKKKINVQQKAAVIITYIGVFLAFYKSNHEGNINLWLGASLIFGSALAYAIYLIGSGQLIPKIGSVRFTSYAMMISCLAVSIHYALKYDLNVFSYPKEVYHLGVGMAFISTIFPSYLLSEAIKRIGASNVAIIGSIGPISTIVLAAIFLGERITVFQFMGTVIVISGVLMIAMNKKEHKE